MSQQTRTVRRQNNHEKATRRKEDAHDRQVTSIVWWIHKVFRDRDKDTLRKLLQLAPHNLCLELAREGVLQDRTHVDKHLTKRERRVVVTINKKEQDLILEALREESVVELFAVQREALARRHHVATSAPPLPARRCISARLEKFLARHS